MTAAERRNEAVRLMKSREKQNAYTNGGKRGYFFGYPNEGDKGWSDCSSAVRACVRRAADIDIGSNTDAQIRNRAKGEVVDLTDGYYPNEANLLPGDCLYFKGNTAHALDAGHVEMYTGANECYGHGSGTGPVKHGLRSYCKTRATAKKRYFMAIRWIPDAEETPVLDDGDAEDDTLTYPVHGVIPDISEYQGEIDYDEFCAGNDCCIARARVNGKTDKLIVKHMQAFAAHGFPFSVYDYVVLRSEKDAVAQADAVYALCAPYAPEVWYLDVEKRALGVTRAKLLGYIRAYIARLRELGVEKIGLYTGDYLWRIWLYNVADVVDDVWIAAYGDNTGYLSKLPTKFAGGLHQHTSAGGSKSKGAPGVNHRVDLNRLTGQKPLSWYTGREYERPDYFGVAQITGNSVNIRTEASALSACVATVKKNVLFARRAGDTGEWYAVWHKDTAAYVAKSMAKEVQG